MGRDKETNYFSHDYNARRDPKIAKLLAKYDKAYQWYFFIVEILAEEPTHAYSLDEFTAAGLSVELRCTEKEADEFINDCFKVKLFLKDDKSFWSDSLNRRFALREEISKKNSRNAKSRWERNAVAERPDAIKRNETKENNTTEDTLESIYALHFCKPPTLGDLMIMQNWDMPIDKVKKAFLKARENKGDKITLAYVRGVLFETGVKKEDINAANKRYNNNGKGSVDADKYQRQSNQIPKTE